MESGLVVDEWVPVDRNNLKTSYLNVYAIGDVTSSGTPKSGLFAESAARTAAEFIIADYHDFEYPGSFSGAGPCYVEFGEEKVGRTDVDFFSKPYPTGVHFEASKELAIEKESIEKQRLGRWRL
jgi:sulfide:quinone oxidoreductase